MPDILLNVHCSICGDRDIGKYASQSSVHPLLRCGKCGHAYKMPEKYLQKNLETQLLYFGEDFINRYDRFTVAHEMINTRRVYKTLNPRRRLDVLEIGPGRGALMNYFAMQGHQVTGLDVSPSVALSIKNRYGLNVIGETLEGHLQRLGNAHYDLVIMCHVLEHMENPRESVRTCVNLLKDGGRIYISVPNFYSWHKRWSGWSGYEPYHLQYFTRSSLDVLASRVEFSRWKLFSYESLSGWSNTVYRTFIRNLHGKTAGGELGGRMNRSRTIFEMVRIGIGVGSSPFRWIQAYLMRGEELILIGEK